MSAMPCRDRLAVWTYEEGGEEIPRRISGAARSAGVRHYLAAGTLEPGFRRSTREWAERLDRAGLACRHEEWTGGHDQLWWQQQLPVALGWLLRA
jgi:enterochelin esterase-like enzyme